MSNNSPTGKCGHELDDPERDVCEACEANARMEIEHEGELEDRPWGRR